MTSCKLPSCIAIPLLSAIVRAGTAPNNRRGDALARGARSFPAAERLITGPSASRGPLRTINVSNSRLNVVEEVGRIFIIGVATGSQSESGIIGQSYGLSAIAHPTKHGDRYEHFLGK